MQRLGIDIGGSGIKGAPVDLDAGKVRPGPPSHPDARGGQAREVARVVAEIVAHFPDVDGPVGQAAQAIPADQVKPGTGLSHDDKQAWSAPVSDAEADAMSLGDLMRSPAVGQAVRLGGLLPHRRGHPATATTRPVHTHGEGRRG